MLRLLHDICRLENYYGIVSALLIGNALRTSVMTGLWTCSDWRVLVCPCNCRVKHAGIDLPKNFISFSSSIFCRDDDIELPS